MPVTSRLGLVALVVADYDEAIEFFVGKLGFTLREDQLLSEQKRWVVVTPPGGGASILLARAVDEQQRRVIGDQAGGRVFLFLETDDFAATHAAFIAKGVRFAEPPRTEPYGTVAVFQDLYGNRWDLIGPAISRPGPIPAAA